MSALNLYTVNGTLERPVQAYGWQVPPRIWRDGETLRYSVGDHGFRECAIATPSAGLLERFVRLVDAEPDTIMRFAKRHGLLGIKKRHDRPKAEQWLVPKGAKAYGYSILEFASYGSQQIGGEPIANWRFWGRRFSAALAIGSCLREGRYGDERHWDCLFGANGYRPPAKGYKCSFEGITDNDIFDEVRGEFNETLNEWLMLGKVQLGLAYDGSGLSFETPTLFSGLLLQLVSAIGGSGGFAICSNCGKPYSPKRQPPRTTRHYCTDCGRRAAVRDAVRAYRIRDAHL
jgi:hypothetical protein